MLDLLLAALSPQGPATAEAAVALAARFCGFDHDGDGRAELPAVTSFATRAAATARPAMLALIEPRLLAEAEAAAPVRAALERWCDDLAREGHDVLAFTIQVTTAAGHQDGRSLLAIRQFARTVQRELRPLSGITLIGAFPHALLVRTCNWWRDDAITLRHGSGDAVTHRGRRWLRSYPEIVAHTADVVLADLDGAWERCYHRDPTPLPWHLCIPADGADTRDGATFALRDHEGGAITLADFFDVADGVVQVQSGDHGLAATPRPHRRDLECSPADRERPNPLAVPDVPVARIDARGVAYVPNAELLDADGKPRATPVPDGAQPHWWHGNWRHSLAFERQLLVDFFARNHAYRTGERRPPQRPASLAHGLGSGFQAMQPARASWPALDPALDVGGEPDLLAVARWFAQPAELRTIRAHSDPWGSVFSASKELAALERAVGGTPWAFAVVDKQLRPSLAQACGGGKLDFFLLRTLWQNGITGNSASFYVHTGCEAISPPNANRLPWSDPGHGAWGGGNAVLFFADGLALVGRAKVFYDEPREFAAALGAGQTFGQAWQRYFLVESAARSWGEVGDDIGRKRAYFWSVLGDASLRLADPGR